MPFILCQVKIPYDSGLPTDATVNTFSFEVADTGDATLGVVATRLSSFYNDVGTGANSPIKDYLGGTINGGATRLKMYNYAHVKPRAPIYDASMPITSVANNALPSEVALCLSFRGPLASGTLAARRRGRVFIGPLSVSSADAQSSEPTRPGEPVRSALLGAGRKLMDASNAAADWVVHSTRATPADITVVHCWVDNAFDTMRSRGPKPSSRLSADRSASL